MVDCVCLQKCPFFNDRMANIPEKAEQMKEKYCRQGGEKCARHMVFSNLGREAVPKDLYPIQVSRAKEIIES
jgi:hypothetical protein